MIFYIIDLQYRKKDGKLKSRLNPRDLATGGGRRSPGSCRRLEGERKGPWSENVFGVMPYIAKLNTSDMSYRWIGHV
jgi:hypothetical protein